MKQLVKTTAAAALAATSLSAAQAEEPVNLYSSPAFEESVEDRNERMQWFRDAKLGMFIHWGLYSQLAGEWKDQKVMGGAEWIQKYLSIPTSEYSELTKSWDAPNYKPREWVKLMKAAGVRYICITTKHHDGFCLWPTKTNDDWNVTMTPYGKDMLKPLADACKAEGVRFSIYHSILDWRHTDWPARLPFNDHATGTPDKEKFKKDYLFPQLEELFTNYGDIGMLWLDGTWDGEWTSQDGLELEKFLRKLQPSVVINNRSGYKPPQPKYDFHIENAYSYIFAGDYISPEGEVPPTGLPGIDWETCQTMQLPNNWGYNRLVGFRPTKDLLQQLVDVTSKGGNLLLNVGPHADGSLLPQAVTALEGFADWMKDNSESIHGTTASPFEYLGFNGRCTQKPGKLFLHVFDWPADAKLVVPAKNKVKRAYLLADKNKSSLDTQRSALGITVDLPKDAPDHLVSVVVVEIEGEADVIAPPKNLALGKPVKVSSSWDGRPELAVKHINDGNSGSMWATEEAARDGWVAIDLGKPATVSAAILSDAPYSRTQEFTLQAKISGGWKQLASGTTIGSNKIISFTPVKAQVFRLKINKASDTPTLADFQLLGTE